MYLEIYIDGEIMDDRPELKKLKDYLWTSADQPRAGAH